MRRLLRSRGYEVIAALAAVGLVAGIWLLLHPASFWMKPWRPETSVVSTRFIFGPYPVEADFAALEKRGATTVISLLDPGLPHEKTLLAQETQLAQQHHLRVLDFPMSSILGHASGEEYLANSAAAANAALASNGSIYFHGYLGLYRAENVRQLLLQTQSTSYSTTMERIKSAYAAGHMDDVLKEAGGIRVKPLEIRSLEGWANYRLNRIDAAQEVFALLNRDRPDALDPATGLGYCALRKGNLDEAGRQFEQVTTQTHEYTTAVEGLGYVRYRQGRADEARALFTRVLAENPDNVEIRELLNRLGDSAKGPAPPAPGGPTQ